MKESKTDAVIIGLFGAIIVIGFFVVWALIIGLPVWLLWNWLMPSLFHLPTISFWQALGLGLLCSFLFGRQGGSKE
jgi:hypothetical protein